jgi:hypothetical protein
VDRPFLHRPIPLRLLNAVGRGAARLGRPFGGRFEEDAVLASARKRTGLDDFGADTFREGLRVFLDSLEREANLSPLGRIMAHGRVVDLLCDRLRLVDWRTRHPEVAKEEIHEPWFVLGLPRTGTTLLHGLLAQDPAHRAPMSWEVAFPVPPAEAATYDTDPRIAAAERMLGQLDRIAPAFQSIHPMGALLPQECVALFAFEFASFEFETAFDVPTYAAWLFRTDMRAAYRFHHDVLQHMQSRYRGERWVLKTPVHLLTIDALLERYPDAKLIQTHRDPLEVMASLSSLHCVLRAAASDAIDPLYVGRQQLPLWSEMLRRGMEAREGRAHETDRFCDVQFVDLLEDPLGCVRRIYDHFGATVSAEAEARMKRFLDENPREKHGTHRYTLETFGIDPVRDARRFDAYCERYGVPRARR